MDPRRRLFVAGAHGFVGDHLVRRAAAEWNTMGGDLRAEADREVSIDVANPASEAAAYEYVRPQVVVLLAALADIDRCEREPQLAQAVNADGAEHIARACARWGARLIYVSSAAVFDGRRHGYRESDEPTPVSVYGRTKAEAERRVASVVPGAAIVRPALVVGRGLRPGTNALLDKLEASFRAGRSVVAPTYELRNPIDVYTLCDFLLLLAARPEARGVFHIGASESASRYQLVLRYAERLGYSKELVTPQDAPVAGRAPRGLDHFLLCERSLELRLQPFPSLEETIERSLYAIT